MVDLGTTKVLVADDEPSTRAMVARHLRSIGYKVIEAVDGDEALELALEHLPDIVVLDVMMPGMSGWEVSRRIRETVSLAHTGVVMLTGIGASLNEITSPLYGADAYLDKSPEARMDMAPDAHLAKPFEFAVLDRTIAETLVKRRDHVGRLDEADVEIVQTMREMDDDGLDEMADNSDRIRHSADADVASAKGDAPGLRKRAKKLRATRVVEEPQDDFGSIYDDYDVKAEDEGSESQEPPEKPLGKSKQASTGKSKVSTSQGQAAKVPAAQPKAAKVAKAQQAPKATAEAPKKAKAAVKTPVEASGQTTAKMTPTQATAKKAPAKKAPAKKPPAKKGTAKVTKPAKKIAKKR